MANRIHLEGGEYTVEDDDGNEVEKNSYWIDVSSSLMNELTALAMETGANPREALADVISGDVTLDDTQPADAETEAEAAEGDD